MRLPNLQKARCCRQNCAIHRELGGQEPATKKQIEYFLFEKMCLPNLQKATVDVADKYWENHGNLGQEPGTKKQFEYLLFEKMRLPNFRTGLEAEAGRQAGRGGHGSFFPFGLLRLGFLMVFRSSNSICKFRGFAGQKHVFNDNMFCSFLPWLLAA